MYRALLVTGLLVVGSSVGAHAFEQTNEVPQPIVPVADGAAAPAAPLPLDVPEAEPEAETGPTLSLPGIGTIGTLPKFDFGLELLYDEDQSKSVIDDEATDSDIRIRGSVKHKF